MKVYVVLYIAGWNNDLIQKIFLSELDAKAFIYKQRDPQNYYINPWPVH